MTMTDPIADMLTRIRNSIRAAHEQVDIPCSRLKMNLVEVIKSEGYVNDYKEISEGGKQVIRIFLKYDDDSIPVIRGIKRVSKPSRRVYARYDRIPEVLNGFGVNIISTSRGLMTDAEARKKHVGGEIICSLW